MIRKESTCVPEELVKSERRLDGVREVDADKQWIVTMTRTEVITMQ